MSNRNTNKGEGTTKKKMVSIDLFVTTPFVFLAIFIICHFTTVFVAKKTHSLCYSAILARDGSVFILCGLKVWQALYPILFTTKAIMDMSQYNPVFAPWMCTGIHIVENLYKDPLLTQDAVLTWLLILFMATMAEYEFKLHNCFLYLLAIGACMFCTLKAYPYLLHTDILPTMLLFTLVRTPEFLLSGQVKGEGGAREQQNRHQQQHAKRSSFSLRCSALTFFIRRVYVRYCVSIMWRIECVTIVSLLFNHIWTKETIPDDAFWLGILLICLYFHTSEDEEEDEEENENLDNDSLVTRHVQPYHVFQRAPMKTPPRILLLSTNECVQEFREIEDRRHALRLKNN
jgi:hypothetical protein